MTTITIQNPGEVHLHFADAAPKGLPMGGILTGALAAALQTRQPSTPPDQGEVWPGQGGHYIGTMPAIGSAPGYHLVASPQRGENLAYGGRDHDTPGATSQHDGKVNTAALLADSVPHPAAQFAAAVRTDGHTDFYLPSRAELLLCWLCAPQLFEKSSYYWSSSQSSRHDAWIQGFEYGSSYWGGKVSEVRAVAVRQIPLL